MIKTARVVFALTLAVLFCAAVAFAQTDPGVQGGSRCTTVNGFQVCTGSPLASVQADGNNTTGIAAFFASGLARFQNVEAVSGTADVGLGPRFNFNQCSGCHAQPVIGGTGPAVNPQFTAFGSCTNGTGTGPGGVSIEPVSRSVFTPGQPFTPIPNPAQNGTIVCNSTNAVPFFVTSNGPTREARFPFFFDQFGNADPNNPNGGVEDLFTVTGRQDGATQAGCSLRQPSFDAARAANNIIFRIPTPTFGAGLIENLDDSTLLANVANINATNNFGVSGTLNHNGNDGTVTRFGWKAQNKSLHIFSGEAYNVEMGISNLLFTQDRPLPGEDGNGGTGGTGLPANCLNLGGAGYPEDTNNPQPGNTASDASAVLDDVSAFANFMRLLAAPVASTTTPGGSASISRGATLFAQIGCTTCHNPTVGNTQASNITAGLGSQPVNAFSDIAVHHMGATLADNVSQGGAGGDQFRTAPLWGVGQRIFLLHDGRTTNLLAAIAAHGDEGSESDIPEDNFDALTASQKQDILNFLRSL